MLVRLLVTPLVLKIVKNLSDEQEIRHWVDVPFYQYLSGETQFHWKPPATCSDLTHFRTRNANKGKDHLLKMSIDPLNQMFQKKEVVIDIKF